MLHVKHLPVGLACGRHSAPFSECLGVFTIIQFAASQDALAPVPLSSEGLANRLKTNNQNFFKGKKNNN